MKETWLGGLTTMTKNRYCSEGSRKPRLKEPLSLVINVVPVLSQMQSSNIVNNYLNEIQMTCNYCIIQRTHVTIT